MKMRFLVFTAALIALSLAASAEIRTRAFKVSGMKSDAAVQRVTTILKKNPGVLNTAADPAAQVLMVRFDNTKTSLLDIIDELESAGYDVEDFDGGTQSIPQAQKQKKQVFTDFQQVLSQTQEFINADRIGIVRNLTFAMKVRRDALVTQVKKDDAKSKYKPGAVTLTTMATDISKAVERYATAAESKDRMNTENLFREVKKSFRRLADQYGYENMAAGTTTQSGTSKSTQDQTTEEKSLDQELKDLLNKL